MDGNGRWAAQRGLPRLAGHQHGTDNIRRITTAAAELGVGYLTLWAFSTDNWRRPREEIDGILRILAEVIEREMEELHRQGAYLGAMFRREVGVPMRQWLTKVRLDHAAALVREGVKIEAVSMLVGYRSKKNVYRQYKRRFGTTPFAHGIAARDGANAMDQEAGACRHAGSIAERSVDRAVSA